MVTIPTGEVQMKIAFGSWLGDLGQSATDLIQKAEALVDKYKDQAGEMYDASRKILAAVKAFINDPSFPTAATLYYLIVSFPVPSLAADAQVQASAEASAEMARIDWAKLADFAAVLVKMIGRFV